MRRRLAVSLCAALACAALASCATGTPDSVGIAGGTLIRHATVVDTRDGALHAGMSLALAGDKIVRVAPDGALRAGAGTLEIDASGLYVVPGYLDMHTHALPLADKATAPWPLMIASGITGIREMGGSPELIRRARQLNAAGAAGTAAAVLAPEILAIPGDILIGIATPAQAAQRVAQQQAMGADFVKLVSASRDGALAVLAEANQRGLTVSGHLPLALSAQEASGAGWRAVEHLGAGVGELLDCAGDADQVRRALLGGAGAAPVASPLAVISPLLYRDLDGPFYQRVLDGYSEEKCRALARTLAANGTWQAPTLIRLRTAAWSDDRLYRDDPNLAYVDQATRALWEQLAQQFQARVTPASAAAFRRYYAAQQRLVRLFGDSGVPLLAGSDLGGIWVIPGVSLHQEFRELAQAGLPPLTILQAATLNGARFLHREASMGTVEQGKNADLVLLDANPLADAANLSAIAGVVLKGRYLDRAALARMKSAMAAAVAAQGGQGADTAIDRAHVH